MKVPPKSASTALPPKLKSGSLSYFPIIFYCFQPNFEHFIWVELLLLFFFFFSFWLLKSSYIMFYRFDKNQYAFQPKLCSLKKSTTTIQLNSFKKKKQKSNSIFSSISQEEFKTFHFLNEKYS